LNVGQTVCLKFMSDH